MSNLLREVTIHLKDGLGPELDGTTHLLKMLSPSQTVREVKEIIAKTLLSRIKAANESKQEGKDETKRMEETKLDSPKVGDAAKGNRALAVWEKAWDQKSVGSGAGTPADGETQAEDASDEFHHPCPVDCQQLTYKQDILNDDLSLEHYNVKPALGSGAVELFLFVDAEERALLHAESKTNKAKSAWFRAGSQVRKGVKQRFVPEKHTAKEWIPRAGAFHVAPSTLHALRRGGTTGLLTLLKTYPDHAGNCEDVCWQLVKCACKAEEGKVFRERLLREGVLSLAISSLVRHKAHWGVQKQGLGLLHYLLCAPGELDEATIDIAVEKGVLKITADAVGAATECLKKLRLNERISASAATWSDVCELGAGILGTVVTTSTGRLRYKQLDLNKLVTGILLHLEGTPHPQSVIVAVESCVAAARRRQKAKRRHSKKRAKK